MNRKKTDGESGKTVKEYVFQSGSKSEPSIVDGVLFLNLPHTTSIATQTFQ